MVILINSIYLYLINSLFKLYKRKKKVFSIPSSSRPLLYSNIRHWPTHRDVFELLFEFNLRHFAVLLQPLQVHNGDDERTQRLFSSHIVGRSALRQHSANQNQELLYSTLSQTGCSRCLFDLSLYTLGQVFRSFHWLSRVSTGSSLII